MPLLFYCIKSLKFRSEMYFYVTMLIAVLHHQVCRNFSNKLIRLITVSFAKVPCFTHSELCSCIFCFL